MRDPVHEFWTWWNWFMSEAGGAWTAVLVAVVAARYARKAWLTSERTLTTSYRPLVKPFKSGDEDFALLLKNYGNGPALFVMLTNAAKGADSAAPDGALGANAVLGKAEIVEPLGPRDGNTKEHERSGRRFIETTAPLVDGRGYRLVYQDLGGNWHKTTFVYGNEIENLRILGPRPLGSIPQAAIDRAAN